ncbi:mitochondrial fission factor homolog B-like isoform X2 [Lepisosteus oculatus]|uniref:mitochondrial fission factor homolog B-like isoform X2 n=1 Tax=Lepisosteus oculatus TaxID=7918 RepID=UPI00371FD680
MASRGFLDEEQSGGRCPDLGFTEVISQRMCVPEHLRVAAMPSEEQEGPGREPPPSFSMHVPDRISLADVPDVSPRPPFFPRLSQGWTPQPPAALRRAGYSGVLSESLAAGWDRGTHRQEEQASLRRSFSDCTFIRSSAAPSSGSRPQQPLQPLYSCLDSSPTNSASFNPVGDHRSGVPESWLSPDAEEGVAVEVIVLRRQISKISHRLAGLERQNVEHRRTELLLFSLLLSACMVNGWLWLRR